MVIRYNMTVHNNNMYQIRGNNFVLLTTILKIRFIYFTKKNSWIYSLGNETKINEGKKIVITGEQNIPKLSTLSFVKV